MKRKYKLLLSTIGLLSIGIATTALVISCGNSSNKNNINSNQQKISNTLTSYFSDTNNQIALINYLLSNGYITYSNGTWNYNTNGYSSWTSALSSGISAFISNNQNISYGRVLGSSINVGNEDNGYNGDLSITNISYSSSTGLVFTIEYNGASANTSVKISSTNLNVSPLNSNLSSISVANSLTTYFSNENNQIALINYLLSYYYITYSNGTWSYNTSRSISNVNNGNGYTSWNSALSSGINGFISKNKGISYNGILGSNINSSSVEGISIFGIKYKPSIGLKFIITYFGANENSEVTISSITLNHYVNTYILTSPSTSISVINALTNYFSDANNQIALINYLLSNGYITYSNGTWNYDSGNNGYTSWDSALSSGISSFISRNQNISYDGILGSNIDVGQYNDNINGSNPNNISITNASYSSSNGITFNILYNNVSANSEITISSKTLSDYANKTSSSIVSALTNYFSDTNNQIALINYLLSNDYITYSNGTWNYDSGNNDYSSWNGALSSGISGFISGNPNISYDGILGSSINVGGGDTSNNLSITNASYSSSNGITFNILYNNVSANSEITISSKTLSDYANKTPSSIVSALTNYFSNTNNQIALINYLLGGYITYSNGTWNYNTPYYSSWASVLGSGISEFILDNNNISYDGILGSSINVGRGDTSNDLSITNASYSSSTGLVFTIAYGGISASDDVEISITTMMNSYNQNNNQNNNESNISVVNAITNYFNNNDNQMSLINYLLKNNYITYSNGTWSYNTTSSLSYVNNGDGYLSWVSALSSGLISFIYGNQSISYDGILGSSINVGYAYNNYDGDLSITNASYNSSTGLVFTIAYDGISASDDVEISITTMNNYNQNNNESNISVVNAITNYFSNSNNQMTLISFLLGSYITYSNGTWNYNTNGYSSWTSALSSGISAFISSNQSISYDGILGSNIDVGQYNNGAYNPNNLSITNVSYSSSTGLVFTIAYDGISASDDVEISITTMNNYNQNNNESNISVVNAITNYFNNNDNQMSLINYLLKNNYITYSNGTWSYNTTSSTPNNKGYSSWTSALSSGINTFIFNNQYISYDGILGSSINVGQYGTSSDLSITNASYNSSTGLVFSIAYNNTSASSKITISPRMLNNVTSDYINFANVLTTYFSNSNNQIALINYLLSNDYIITYNNGAWNYGAGVYGYGAFSSWDSALSYGISAFISNNQSISYDGILGSSINVGYGANNYDGDLSIINASYSSSTGLVFTIIYTYNGVSTSDNVTISSANLNSSLLNSNLSSISVANSLTTYFSNSNNQMALISYLLSNDYITYNNGAWNYGSNYSSWDGALSSGISRFISFNPNISYDGILGSNINVGQSNNDSTNPNDLLVTNASYSSSNGITFNILYNNVSANSEITISSILKSISTSSSNSTQVSTYVDSYSELFFTKLSKN